MTEKSFFQHTTGSVTSETIISAIDAFVEQRPVEDAAWRIIVMDNAPTHRSEAFSQKIDSWLLQRVGIHFLPAYSPELNAIEILWRFIKYMWLPITAYSSFSVLKSSVLDVLENVGVQKQFKTLNGKNNEYTHWSLGYGAIFLAHVFKLTDAKWLNKSTLKGIKSKLTWIRGKIYSGMKESGGFGHGPGGPNVLGYVELEAMSNLLLSALGCIKQCGIDLDAKKLEPMLKFCEACTNAEGSVGYSTTEPQSFIHLPTRSAGLSNALAALSLKEHALFSKVTACAEAHFAEAFGGHSTPVMGVLAMALVAKREGAFDDFWKAMRHEFTMLQSPDNTFSYRPTADTQMLGMNLDRDMNACWTTSHWVLVLCLEKTGVPLCMGA